MAKRSELGAALINGTATGAHEYPFIAAVVYATGLKRVMCGGFIIDKHHILIAAHCVNGVRAPSLGVHVGRNKFNPAAAELKAVAAIHSHPQWDAERLRYDVALLQLQDPIHFNHTRRAPVCLPGRAEKLDNKTAAALSWAGPFGGNSSLLQTKFELHALTSCSARPTGGPQFCAWAPGADACDRYTDGPLLAWQQPKRRDTSQSAYPHTAKDARNSLASYLISTSSRHGSKAWWERPAVRHAFGRGTGPYQHSPVSLLESDDLLRQAPSWHSEAFSGDSSGFRYPNRFANGISHHWDLVNKVGSVASISSPRVAEVVGRKQIELGCLITHSKTN